MDKYAQLNRFHRDLHIQVYMYYFMYVDPKINPMEDHFPAKIFFYELQENSNYRDSPKTLARI